MWTKVPFYLKATICLLGLFLTGLIIVLGKDIIVPITFAILLAILLLPLNNWLEKIKTPRVVAIIISIVIAFTILMGIIYFMSTQVTAFTSDMPAIKKQLLLHANTVQSWVRQTFHITGNKQVEYFNNATESIKLENYVQKTLLSITDTLVLLVLLPVYTFLILYYRSMLCRFFKDIFPATHSTHVNEVLNESKSIIQNYMVGLMMEMAIVTVLNAVGFLIIGIQYAIFLAVLSAVLNIIPYIGMLIATIFCMLVTLTTAPHFSDILWVWVVLLVVQFIDNNLLMPKIVGSKVKINSLITIIGVIIGGALCGMSGMFLAIPFIAILKVIFDKTDGMKPWGMLLGDDITVYEPSKIYRRITTWRQKPEAIVPVKVDISDLEETPAL